MSPDRKFPLVLSAFIFLYLGPLNSPAQEGPRSCAPALEEAAAAFAESNYELAERHFSAISSDPQTAAFVRGLAAIGAAETALAKKDADSAQRTWKQIASNEALPEWQREIARRRMIETERKIKGLPERDPLAYRMTLPEFPKPGALFYVSPSGNDASSGSKAHPFATLVRARDAIRKLRKAGGGALPRGGVKVIVQKGDYYLREPFTLGREDSGASNAPIVYVAQRMGAAVLQGGMPLGGWRPIADSAVSTRLDPRVRDRVLEADLRTNRIEDWGDATALKRRPELFANGEPQTLARWPNEGFVSTGEILGTNTFKVWGSIQGCKDGTFRFLEDRPTSWLDEPDVRLYGYWFWDWFEEYQKVAAIDAEKKIFRLAEPFSNYGYRKGQRYFAVNVLRELDQPGEWYLERRVGKIYWLPPERLKFSKAEIILSIRSEPFIVMENVEHVTLVGLTIEDGRGDGIHIKSGTDCLVAGCTIRRLGGDAVIIEGGLRHAVFGCTMHTLGCGGMRVNGGDRQSLSPGKHIIENCTVSDIARLKHTYAPAVHLDGCGNRVAHNLFERIPSSAMRIEGNDHLIELNRIRNVVQESDDQGGIDMFGNPLYRGVVIRWNRWSDITGGTECGAAGIRLDDMISGIVVHGNLFERCGAVQFGGVQVHGGKENVIDGNLFLDCHAAVSFSRWDQPRWLNAIQPFLKQAGSASYAYQYPELAQLKSDPNVNFITRNVLFRCKNVFLRDGGVEKSALISIRGEAAPAALVQKGRLKESNFRLALFPTIPMTEMGTYAHSWRAPSQDTNPARR